MKVKVGISNRHVHLTKDDFKVLFGTDNELEIYRELMQTNEFASNYKVKLIGPRSEIDNVRIIGPFRNYSQVEVSKTDSYVLGIDPPIRTSGDVLNSSPIMIEGTNGRLELKEGCIIANRHLHLTLKDVIDLGLEGVEKVAIKITNEKGGILDNVYLKVSKDAVLECHLDTDDGNGNLLKTGQYVEIIR